jgi:hypothetical protein
MESKTVAPQKAVSSQFHLLLVTKATLWPPKRLSLLNSIYFSWQKQHCGPQKGCLFSIPFTSREKATLWPPKGRLFSIPFTSRDKSNTVAPQRAVSSQFHLLLVTKVILWPPKGRLFSIPFTSRDKSITVALTWTVLLPSIPVVCNHTCFLTICHRSEWLPSLQPAYVDNWTNFSSSRSRDSVVQPCQTCGPHSHKVRPLNF